MDLFPWGSIAISWLLSALPEVARDTGGRYRSEELRPALDACVGTGSGAEQVTGRTMARRWQLEQTQIIPRPRGEVFAFFADAHNLERLTPDFLGFEILTPRPIEMKPGALIDYSLRLYGLPVNWKTRIEVFEPETRFVDTQLEGPYRYWRHLHEFEDVEQGTRMRDVVNYEIPFGLLGTVARALFVRGTLERIFGYRRQAITGIFGAA